MVTLQNLIPSFPWIAPGWRAGSLEPGRGIMQPDLLLLAQNFLLSDNGTATFCAAGLDGATAHTQNVAGN